MEMLTAILNPQSSIFDLQSSILNLQSSISTLSSNCLRQSLLLEPFDGRAEPILDCVLGLALILIPFQLIDGSSGGVQWDVMARHIFSPLLWRNEINQQTLVARVASFNIAEVEAAWRILKNRSRLPRCFDRTAVATFLDEVEFSFQNLKSVAIIFTHRSPPVVDPHYFLNTERAGENGRSFGKWLLQAGLTCRSRGKHSPLGTLLSAHPRGFVEARWLWNLMRLGAAVELILFHLFRAVRWTHSHGEHPEPRGLRSLDRYAVKRHNQLS